MLREQFFLILVFILSSGGFTTDNNKSLKYFHSRLNNYRGIRFAIFAAAQLPGEGDETALLMA